MGMQKEKNQQAEIIWFRRNFAEKGRHYPAILDVIYHPSRSVNATAALFSFSASKWNQPDHSPMETFSCEARLLQPFIDWRIGCNRLH
jgi:hypothetical protein